MTQQRVKLPPVTPELLAGLEKRFAGMSKDVVANHMRWADRYRTENEAAVVDEVAIEKARRRALTADQIAYELADENWSSEEFHTFLADCGYVRKERES